MTLAATTLYSLHRYEAIACSTHPGNCCSPNTPQRFGHHTHDLTATSHSMSRNIVACCCIHIFSLANNYFFLTVERVKIIYFWCLLISYTSKDHRLKKDTVSRNMIFPIDFYLSCPDPCTPQAT